MPSIKNLNITLSKGHLSNRLDITYEIHFSKWEQLDHTTFIERIGLGLVPTTGSKKNFKVLSEVCIQASIEPLHRAFVKNIKQNIFKKEEQIKEKINIFTRIVLSPFEAKMITVDSSIKEW